MEYNKTILFWKEILFWKGWYAMSNVELILKLVEMLIESEKKQLVLETKSKDSQDNRG